MPEADVGILLSAKKLRSENKFDLLLFDLKKRAPESEVSASEVEKLLNCDRSKARRVLSFGLSKGEVIKVGAGKYTRYKLVG